MGKVWVLDTETKGTGANVVPLDKLQRRPEPPDKPRPRPKAPARPAAKPSPREPRPQATQRTATALPPGHVRKKATGELGKVQAVDARAGTATVRWLKSGASSTVPLSTISRR
jgi:hypothetical protein